MWSILTPILISVLMKYVGKWAADLFAKYLPTSDEHAPPVPMFTGSAPDEFKLWLQSVIIEAIQKYVKRPIIAGIMIRVVKSLDGAILDAIWDEFFTKNIVTVQPPVRLMATPSDGESEEDDTKLAIELSADEKHFLREEGVTV